MEGESYKTGHWKHIQKPIPGELRSLSKTIHCSKKRKHELHCVRCKRVLCAHSGKINVKFRQSGRSSGHRFRDLRLFKTSFFVEFVSKLTGEREPVSQSSSSSMIPQQSSPS